MIEYCPRCRYPGKQSLAQPDSLSTAWYCRRCLRAWRGPRVRHPEVERRRLKALIEERRRRDLFDYKWR